MSKVKIVLIFALVIMIVGVFAILPGCKETTAPAEEEAAAEEVAEEEAAAEEVAEEEAATEEVAEEEAAAEEVEGEVKEVDPTIQEAIKNFKSGDTGFEVGEGKYTIGISLCLFDQPAWVGMYAGMLQGAKDYDAKIIMQNANLDVMKQMAHFEDYITQGVDGLILVPTDAEASTAVAELANDAGIPLVEANRVTRGGDYASALVDNKEMGRLAAEAMKLAADEQGFDEVNVMILVGDLKIGIAQERHNSFISQTEEYPGFKIVAQMPTEWLHENVYPAVVDGFSAHPEVNAIYVSSELMLQPALSALDSLDKLHPVGEPGHVLFTGIDGMPSAFDSIREGYYDASINQPMFGTGYKAVESLVKMIKGETLETKNIVIAPQMVTNINVDDESLWGNAFKELVQ